jgi:hypothetical protein
MSPPLDNYVFEYAEKSLLIESILLLLESGFSSTRQKRSYGAGGRT